VYHAFESIFKEEFIQPSLLFGTFSPSCFHISVRFNLSTAILAHAIVKDVILEPSALDGISSQEQVNSINRQLSDQYNPSSFNAIYFHSTFFVDEPWRKCEI